jgi:DNA modification methylase
LAVRCCNFFSPPWPKTALCLANPITTAAPSRTTTTTRGSIRHSVRSIVCFAGIAFRQLLQLEQGRQFIAAWREAGFHIAGHLTFVKKYASRKRFLAYAHENAYLLAKGSPSLPAQPISDVIEWQYTGNKLHPTQKPLCVLKPLIESFSLPGDVVLDPFCGSGSTLLAAQQSGRQ